MSYEECPIQIGHILCAMARGEAKPFTKSDYEAFAGVEGEDAYTLEMDGCLVILDIGPMTVFQVLRYDEATDKQDVWMWEADQSWNKIV